MSVILSKKINTSTLNIKNGILVLRSQRNKKTLPKLHTAHRRHWVKSLGIYVSDVLSSGNSKLDSSMLIFDMLAIATCKNNSKCASSCYAMKAQRQYPGTYNKRAIHTWLARHDRKALWTLITKQLLTTDKKVVRIHSSGDFETQAYINMWTAIVKEFPKISFYAYTKVDKMFDFSKINSLKNFNMVESVLPDGSVNFGSLEYIRDRIRKFGGYLCPYGIPGAKDMKCGVDCKLCINNNRVYFKAH